MTGLFISLSLFDAALIALYIRAGGGHPLAPYVMGALIGASWMLWLLGRRDR